MTEHLILRINKIQFIILKKNYNFNALFINLLLTR
jgi:hypothetical protein